MGIDMAGIDLDKVLGAWSAPETFEIPVLADVSFRVKTPSGYSAWTQIERTAQEQGRVLWNLIEKGSAQFKGWPYIPQTFEECYIAKIIQQTVVEPELTDRDACRLMEKPLLAKYIVNSIERGIKDAATVILAKKVEDEKKDCSGTKDNCSSPDCAETCGENSPAS